MNFSVESSTFIFSKYLTENINRIHQNVNKPSVGSKFYCATNKFIVSKPLSSSWYFLNDFKSIAGIYQFLVDSESYIGSTKDIYKRCFTEHKNNAFVKTKKHRLFYNSVIKNGWDKYTLNIICVIPNYGAKRGFCREISWLYFKWSAYARTRIIAKFNFLWTNYCWTTEYRLL